MKYSERNNFCNMLNLKFVKDRKTNKKNYCKNNKLFRKKQ